MKKRKRFAPYLLISILSLVGFILYINTFSPTSAIDFFGISISSLIPFLSFVFLVISCLFAFILAHSRRGLFVGLFLVCFLILQLIRFNNVFYTAILLAIFILLEFLFLKKKE